MGHATDNVQEPSHRAHEGEAEGKTAPKASPRKSKSVSASREGTFQVIAHNLKTNPAYLLLFGVGLLGGTMGVGVTAVGMFKDHTQLQILGFLTWALLLIAALLVIWHVERQRQGGPNSPIMMGTGSILGAAACDAFLKGPPATRLDGRWLARWYIGEGSERSPHPEDPKEEVDVRTEQCRVSAVSRDPSQKSVYWLDGRFCDKGIVTLLYWSKPDPGKSELTGVVLVQSNGSYDVGVGKLTGSWIGFSRHGEIVKGEVELSKIG